MESLVSRQEIDDARYSVYERCATFERNLVLTDTRLVKLANIKQLFLTIAKRIINVGLR